MRWLRFALICVLITATAVFVSVKLGNVELRRLSAQLDSLQKEKQHLLEYARRLSATRRVAQVDVLEQHIDEQGRIVSTLRWQEIGADGTLAPPLTIETVGQQVYFEALVIKFEPQFVGDGDPERGTSLAMFRRVFGERQPPSSVAELDRQARPPLPPGEEQPRQEQLWQRFWEMVDDPRVAARFGVRVAQCEAPSVPVRAGQVWEVTLDALGGVNLRRISVKRSGGRRWAPGGNAAAEHAARSFGTNLFRNGDSPYTNIIGPPIGEATPALANLT